MLEQEILPLVALHHDGAAIKALPPFHVGVVGLDIVAHGVAQDPDDAIDGHNGPQEAEDLVHQAKQQEIAKAVGKAEEEVFKADLLLASGLFEEDHRQADRDGAEEDQ